MTKEQRRESRKLVVENSSVEFRPENAEIAYHFKLRDYSSKGLGILVKEDSNVLDLLNVGDVLEMKYYQGDERPMPVSIRTRVEHISPPDKGKCIGHMIVGIYILDKELRFG